MLNARGAAGLLAGITHSLASQVKHNTTLHYRNCTMCCTCGGTSTRHNAGNNNVYVETLKQHVNKTQCRKQQIYTTVRFVHAGTPEAPQHQKLLWQERSEEGAYRSSYITSLVTCNMQHTCHLGHQPLSTPLQGIRPLPQR